MSIATNRLRNIEAIIRATPVVGFGNHVDPIALQNTWHVHRVTYLNPYALDPQSATHEHDSICCLLKCINEYEYDTRYSMHTNPHGLEIFNSSRDGIYLSQILPTPAGEDSRHIFQWVEYATGYLGDCFEHTDADAILYRHLCDAEIIQSSDLGDSSAMNHVLFDELNCCYRTAVLHLVDISDGPDGCNHLEEAIMRFKGNFMIDDAFYVE